MKNGYLPYLPVSLFGSVMGLSGLSIGWKLAGNYFGFTQAYSLGIGALAVAVFIAMCVAYGIKVCSSFQNFKDEFNNPMLKSFYGTFTISILLLPIILVDFAPKLAFGMWVVGAVLMAVFAVYMVSFWFNNAQNLSSVTPAWIIPVVGTLDIPLAMNLFGYELLDVGVAALGVGLFFAIPVFVIIMTKLLFSEPMPDKLLPTLMILLAPFSVGFSAYVEVVGSVDIFAKALYFIGLFLLFALFAKLRNASKCCPFRVTWWAISFPLAAHLVATIKLASVSSSFYLDALSIIFLVVFTAMILWLFIRTIKGIIKGELKNLV